MKTVSKDQHELIELTPAEQQQLDGGSFDGDVSILPFPRTGKPYPKPLPMPIDPIFCPLPIGPIEVAE